MHVCGSQTQFGLWGPSNEIWDLFWLAQDVGTLHFVLVISGWDGWGWTTRIKQSPWLHYSAIVPRIHRTKNPLWHECNKSFPAPSTFLIYMFTSLRFVLIFPSFYPVGCVSRSWGGGLMFLQPHSQHSSYLQVCAFWLSGGSHQFPETFQPAFQATTWEACSLFINKKQQFIKKIKIAMGKI